MCNTSVYLNFQHYFQYLQVDYKFILDSFRNIIRTFVANGLKSLDNITVAWKKNYHDILSYLYERYM